MTTLPLPRLLSHGLAAPTADDCRAAVRTGDVAADRASWLQVCGEAQLPVTCYLLDVPELEALTSAISRLPGTRGLAGRALAIRVGTYRVLAPTADGAEPHSLDWGRRAHENLLRQRPTNPLRNAEIADLDVFGEDARHELDKVAARAANRFDAQAAQVTVVLEGAQYIAGQLGLDAWVDLVPGIPVEWSFCATSTRTREPYLLPDASADVLHRANPVVEKMGIRTYAGAPMITSRSFVLGSVCLTGSEPHEWTDSERDELAAMAAATVEQIERTRISGRRERHDQPVAQDAPVAVARTVAAP